MFKRRLMYFQSWQTCTKRLVRWSDVFEDFLPLRQSWPSNLVREKTIVLFVFGNREENSSDEGAKFRADTEIFKNPSCGFWHLPVCQNYKSKTGCTFGNKCYFRHVWGWGRAQPKVKEGWCERISCDIEGVHTTGLCISRLLSEKVFFYVNQEIWDQSTPSNSPRHLAPNQHSGKKGSIARKYPKVCASWALSLRAKIRGKITWGDLAPRKMRPQSSEGLGENSCKLETSDRTTFHAPHEAKVMPAPTSTRPEEREFAVDSGASMHMMCKKELNSGEMDTVKRFRTPKVVLTANGEVQTHEEAQVFVHDLNLFVTVQLLDQTPAVLSLGKLCKDHGYSYEWVSGQKPQLTKDGKTIICKTDNFVPLVVPGLSTNPESSSSSASLSQYSLRKEAERATRELVPPASISSSSSVSERSDELSSRRLVPFPKIQNQNKKRSDRDPLADLPDCLQDFTENLKETELHASAHSSVESDLEYPTTVTTKSRKHSIYTHFPEDRDCDVCLRTKITKASCRRRTGEALVTW